jgi:hypothetical protein
MRVLIISIITLLLFSCGHDEPYYEFKRTSIKLEEETKEWIPDTNYSVLNLISTDSIKKRFYFHKIYYDSDWTVDFSDSPLFEEKMYVYYESFFKDEFLIKVSYGVFGQQLYLRYNDDWCFYYSFDEKRTWKVSTVYGDVSSTIVFFDSLNLNGRVYYDVAKIQMVEIDFKIPEHYPFTVYLAKHRGLIQYVEKCGIVWRQ